MRTFIAITLPDEINKNIFEFQSELKKENILIGNWTSNYHITLKFLGEVNEEKLSKIIALLDTICRKTKKFELTLKGIAAFPSENHIRVVFANIGEGNESAMFLQRQIDTVLKKENFLPEKNYQNHITLIRVKSIIDKGKLKDIFEKYKNKSFGTFTVGHIELIKSTLTPGGPIYEVIKKFQLS